MYVFLCQCICVLCRCLSPRNRPGHRLARHRLPGTYAHTLPGHGSRNTTFSKRHLQALPAPSAGNTHTFTLCLSHTHTHTHTHTQQSKSGDTQIPRQNTLSIHVWVTPCFYRIHYTPTPCVKHCSDAVLYIEILIL